MKNEKGWKKIKIVILHTDGELRERNGRLSPDGKTIDSPYFSANKTYMREGQSRIWLPSALRKVGLGNGRKESYFFIEGIAQSVFFRPHEMPIHDLYKQPENCIACMKGKFYSLASAHQVHEFKTNKVERTLIQEASRTDDDGGVTWQQIALLIMGAIGCLMLVMIAYGMGFLDPAAYGIGGLAMMKKKSSFKDKILKKKSKQKTKKEEVEEVEDEVEEPVESKRELSPVEKKFVEQSRDPTEGVSEDDVTGEKVRSTIEQIAEQEIQESSLQHDLFTQDDLDIKTRLTPRLTVAMQNAEMEGDIHDIDIYYRYTEGLKAKRISLLGESRKEGVEMTKGVTLSGFTNDKVTQG